MSNLIKINNQDLQVKEFEGQRVVTFKDIDNLHHRAEGTAGRNFRDNKKHFVEQQDFFSITGTGLKELKQATNFVGSNAKEIILVTESGYLMLVKSLTDDLAWKVQRELVKNYFRAKEDMAELSPQLQLLINMELEQKKLKQQLNEVNHHALEAKAEVQAIRDVITIDPKEEWRKQTNILVNKICKKKQDYRTPKEQIYKALESRGRCKLKTRLDNLKGRALMQGMVPSTVEKFNNLDVIANDVRLKEIYIALVKEMAIKYGVA